MKKTFLILAAIIILCLVGIYVLIPSKITISKSVNIEANRNALYRKVENFATWNEWWPGTIDSSGFYLDNLQFHAAGMRTLSVPLAIDDNDLSDTAELTLIPVSTDSTILHIETTLSVSANPFRRVRSWYKARKLGDSFSKILQSLQGAYSKLASLYDFDIQKKLVVDSILVFTSEETKGYPSVEKVYALIDRLKVYIREHSATETGFPMQNIYTADSINYLIKVAIPVNERLPDSANIHYKWMLGGGNILITEVKGGPSEIIKAYRQIANYVSDYGRVAPAISFESLVTDRRAQPDSSKWITRIYYPVM